MDYIQELSSDIFDEKNVKLTVLRLDLLHPKINGNKWYKLKYNLSRARTLKKNTLLSFGGAYSNHIRALATAGNMYNFQTIGLIRGEEHQPLNAVLQHAVDQGMQLKYISREAYREKTSSNFMDELKQQFDDFYLLPEGGTNDLAIKGASEILEEVYDEYDYVCCPIGTGGTMAGLIIGMEGVGKVLGVSVLKGGAFLVEEVQKNLQAYDAYNDCLTESNYTNWEILTDYHFGGYAKSSTELENFMHQFQTDFNIPLEFVYSGKLFYAIWDWIQKGNFKENSSILMVHTGGIYN